MSSFVRPRMGVQAALLKVTGRRNTELLWHGGLWLDLKLRPRESFTEWVCYGERMYLLGFNLNDKVDRVTVWGRW